jgi:hypothetical protein
VGGARESEEGGTLTPKDSENVLEIFCTKYGFCLNPEGYDRLADSPPTSPRAYVDAVIVAYGLDPATVDPKTHQAMQGEVRDAMARHGAASGGLPPNTSLERTRER